MLVRQAFRYRLYPSGEQRHQLAVQFGHARHAYNWALACRQEHYRETGVALSFYDLKRAVTALKSEPDHLWLKEADSQVLQAKVEDLEKSYKGFFTHRTDFPRFKTKKDRQSIRYPQRFRFKDNRIYLPKVGWVRAAFHREMVGTPKNVTVSKTAASKYYASVQCERELDIPVHTGPAVGVDVGLKDLATLSTGEKIPHPTHLRKAEKRLAQLQRSSSRKVKGSKNREKARVLVARQHEHVANCRRDTLHKLSDRLTRENSVIRMENLNIRGMLKNHALAKGIADSGWATLVSFCQYKAMWRGGVVEQIDRFYPSTKTCHVCAYKNDALTLKDREWTCPQCGTVHDRDVNAARVILAAPTVAPGNRPAVSRPAAPSRSRTLPPERRNVKPVERPSDAKAVGRSAGLDEAGSPALCKAG
jgi:putative transposase